MKVLKTSSTIDENFESNDLFLKHWYFDWNFFNNSYGPERHFDVAIGTDEYRPDAGTNMPFNGTGSKHFSGWYENEQGYVANDEVRYRFKSRPFVLGGTGLVSIKMAGRTASLHQIHTRHHRDTKGAGYHSITLSALRLPQDKA